MNFSLDSFIAGMLFVYVVSPLLDGAVALILSILDALKSKISIISLKSAVQIQKFKDSLDDSTSNPISFQVKEDSDE